MLRRATQALACCSLIATSAVVALETDQYYGWDRELRDSTPQMNAKVNADLEALLERINRRSRDKSCSFIRRQFQRQYRSVIFHPFETWADNSKLVARIPDGEADELYYRRHHLYANAPSGDIGRAIPPGPTVKAGGVRFGTDKLSHFFSGGFKYYRVYRKAKKRGASEELSELAAIESGIELESEFLGMGVTGIFSVGDLEANWGGYEFYRELCEGERAIAERVDGVWRVVRPFDFANYITPEWDESYKPCAYTQTRWRKVRHMVASHCSKFRNEKVQRMRAEYAARDTVTPTERALQKYIDSGEIPDPDMFSIETQCDRWATLELDAER